MLLLLKILLLAIIQGAAELLPVSSSAHVTVAARLLHYDVSDVRWTFLLIMLHTGTMFAVLLYFWRRWIPLLTQWPVLIAATLLTGGIGLVISEAYYKITGRPIETIFRVLPLIAASLAAAGILILIAGYKDLKKPGRDSHVGMGRGLAIGLVQAISLPFRGFSRSGATISAAMLMGVARMTAEEFSFALAVLLTPILIAKEVHEVVKDNVGKQAIPLGDLFVPGLIGMLFSFVAGLLALRWLSRWMEQGRWHWFGYYCLVAAAATLAVHFALPPA
jgi:undecaprenyl-diphosphatase